MSSAPLPEGWTSHHTKEGKLYYFHSESKKSSWTRPVEEPAVKAPSSNFSNDGSFMDKVRAMQKQQQGKSQESPGKCAVAAPTSPGGAISGVGGDAATSLQPDTFARLTGNAEKRKADELVGGGSNSISGRSSSSSISSISEGSKLVGKAPRLKSGSSTKKEDGSAEEYLRQVELLSKNDRSDEAGGKWLVR